MLEPEVPVIVADAQPGSAGAFLNAYAVEQTARWAAAVNAADSDEGIFAREVEVSSFDELVAGLEADRDRLIGLGVDVTVDPLP